MTNARIKKRDPELSDAVSSSRAGRFAGPVIIAMAALIMMVWSWGTWPDPLVDFGAQLYVPWQISTGHVLYRDIAYYNGPLSSYFNAVAFDIFGVGMNTLIWVNLLILIAAMTLGYRLTLRASGRWPALMAGLTFALVFAFGQVVRLGNYNWLTPYTHEVTHGTVLGLAAIASVARFQRTGKHRWLALAGGLLGMVFLTKAEPTAASFAAVVALLAGGWWVARMPPRSIIRDLGLLVGCTLIPSIVAWVMLATAMPAGQALRGVLGSWPWVMDRRITSLHFYRAVSGIDDVGGNVSIMARWTLVYALVLGTAVGLGLLCRSARSRRIVSAAAFLGCSVLIAWRFSQSIVPGMLTPLPICLAGALLTTARAVVRRTSSTVVLRFGLVVFSTVLVAKMGLTTRAYHYGFVLAWPATVVLICAVTQDLPMWVETLGGAGRVVRAVGLSAWIGGMAAILYSNKINFDKKQFIVAAGTRDEFRGDGRAVQVRQLCDRISQLVPANGTVMVLPQGLMINYLTRRPSPTRNINFMPPEVLAAGEGNILAGLVRHPPDVVVLTPAVIEDGSFTLDDRDPYGADTLKWVMRNYVPFDDTEMRKPLVIMIRKSD